jgi:hypothetical protein
MVQFNSDIDAARAIDNVFGNFNDTFDVYTMITTNPDQYDIKRHLQYKTSNGKTWDALAHNWYYGIGNDKTLRITIKNAKASAAAFYLYRENPEKEETLYILSCDVKNIRELATSLQTSLKFNYNNKKKKLYIHFHDMHDKKVLEIRFVHGYTAFIPSEDCYG